MTNESTPPQTVGSNDGLGPLPARWYCINSRGVATLCVNERDAKSNAANCDKMYPAYAPHRAVLLGDVSAERGRCTALAADFQEYLYRIAAQVPFDHAEWAQQRGAALLAALRA